MRPRDWWLGIAALVLAILAHAAIPRYEYRNHPLPSGEFYMIRVDRWTGRAEIGTLGRGRPWQPLR